MEFGNLDWLILIGVWIWVCDGDDGGGSCWRLIMEGGCFVGGEFFGCCSWSSCVGEIEFLCNGVYGCGKW